MKIIIILVFLLILTGCDNIKKCSPQINPKTGYVGISCSGEF